MATTSKTPIDPGRNEGQARVAEGAKVEGRWSGGDLWVEGTLEGDVILSGVLRVGRTGRLFGQVRAAVAEIEGSFDGEIVTRLLVFGETARAKGSFASERLMMRDGATVDGAFQPAAPEPIVAPAPAPVAPVAPVTAAAEPASAPAVAAESASQGASPDAPAAETKPQA
jgi:cytoskeletal protein CcmA (bactofilin family)